MPAAFFSSASARACARHGRASYSRTPSAARFVLLELSPHIADQELPRLGDHLSRAGHELAHVRSQLSEQALDGGAIVVLDLDFEQHASFRELAVQLRRNRRLDIC